MTSSNHTLIEKRIRYLVRKVAFENSDIGSFNDIALVDFFILSPPKTSTTTLQRSLEAIGQKVLHAHNDKTTYNAFGRRGKLLQRAGITLESLVRYRLSLRSSPIHIFFGYRDPVSWYLSLAGHFQLDLNKELRNRILINIYDSYPWSDYLLCETRDLVEKIAGIKLLAEKFDFIQGYKVINTSQVKIVLYRYDKVGALKDYFREGLGLSVPIGRERENLDSIYKEYRSNFVLERDTLDVLFDNEYVRFFYTVEEIEDLKVKFQAPDRNPPS